MEIIWECWHPRFGQIEEVRKFLLWRWRFVALVTADASSITDVWQVRSIAQPRRTCVRPVRFRSAQSILCPSTLQMGWMKMGNPQLHPSLTGTHKRGVISKPYTLSSCLLHMHVVHKRQLTRNKGCDAMRSAIWQNTGMHILSGELLE